MAVIRTAKPVAVSRDRRPVAAGAVVGRMRQTADVPIAAERFTRQDLAIRVRRDRRPVTAVVTAPIQAQDDHAARLGVRARLSGITAAEVIAALDTERTLARTWMMRGTIHLVAAEDLPWLVRLLGPSVTRRYRTRWRSIGLTDQLLDRTAELMPELLAEGPRTRHELVAGLLAHGISLQHLDPQAATHVVLHASCAGLVCRGPDRGRERTFVRTDHWLADVPAGPTGDDALAELTRRYFAAFSPATAADFTAWSGLPSRAAISLIRDELTPVDVHAAAGYRLGSIEPTPGVRLAPAFDNYLIGYRRRTALLADHQHQRVYQGGMIRPTLLVDGRIVGTWTLDRDRISVGLFEPVSRRAGEAVEAEAADIGRFLGRPCSVEITPAI